MSITRRQFTVGVAGAIAATVGKDVFAAESPTFRLRYIVASCMYGKLPLADADLPYSAFLEAAAPRAGLRWKVVGKLPPGLRLDRRTGEIHGLPHQPGEYSFDNVSMRRITAEEGAAFKDWRRKHPEGTPVDR